ncbi:BRCT domain-containing protein [Pseudomonas sp. OTU750018]|uniref:BRCT domain-containing protein n=1 Tax=Pseudomonas sp. OTU750018 TaxID=2709708 RepID=UPI001422F334|nr:BRCT domain-containing protein [Pseudomonas sp. OTU750018]
MLKFIYTNAKGETAEWTLTRWRENSLYIQGRSETDYIPRTFRKDRVQRYLSGEEQLLFEKASPAPQPLPKAALDQRPQILFTGFKSTDRKSLEAKAVENGLRVMKTPTKLLSILCIGYNAGPSKIESARESGAFIMNEFEFEAFLATGELPC